IHCAAVACANVPVLSFFTAYGDHPDLHSFPTRRSSDLGHAYCFVGRFMALIGCPTHFHVVGIDNGISQQPDVLASLPRRDSRGRSEEHTSELQSRENLVCRLLLEKKKKTKQSPPLDCIT